MKNITLYFIVCVFCSALFSNDKLTLKQDTILPPILGKLNKEILATEGVCYSYACSGRVSAIEMYSGNFYRFSLDIPYDELEKANCTRAQLHYYPTFTLLTSHPKAEQIQQALTDALDKDIRAFVTFATGSSDCRIQGITFSRP